MGQVSKLDRNIRHKKPATSFLMPSTPLLPFILLHSALAILFASPLRCNAQPSPHSHQHTAPSACPRVKIAAHRLPDLNIPRSGHALFCTGGIVTAVGGHTTNFVPTATAEYFKDGKWHLIETAFPHDNGVCLVLSSGKVLIGGGSEKALGIGQTFPVEEYDPETHTFHAFSCFDTKRTLASAIELDSGHVVVAGNWYGGDSIELFDGDRYFHFAKDVAIQRASPYILRSASDDVLILGNGGTHGEVLRSDIVDRLKGTPLRVPLLKRWQPLFHESPMSGSTGFIGDESRGDYSWLLPVQDWTEGDTTNWMHNRQLAFMLVRDTTFALLPTTCPAPREGPGGDIFYSSPVLADRRSRRGYVHGFDKDNRHYVLCIQYDQRPAPLTLYYTDPLPEAGWPQINLTEDGNLMIAGGINYNRSLGGTLDNDNYSPLATAYLLEVNPGNRSCSAVPQHPFFSHWTLFAIPLLAALLLAAVLLVRLKRRKHSVCTHTAAASPTAPTEGTATAAATPLPPSGKETLPDSEALIMRIRQLMDEQQPYLNAELKLTDLATRLATNRNAISACINSQCHCTFSHFVNSYRIAHAKQLLRLSPEMKMTEVWMQSGFAAESSFFRAFKTITGMTPNEWKEKEE